MEQEKVLRTKDLLRSRYRTVRKNITRERDSKAKKELFVQLFKRLSRFSSVLSYFSLDEELGTDLVNQMLLEQGKLALPKIEGEHLVAYTVRSFDRDLMQYSHQFLEPNSRVCQEATNIDCILVPGVAFDKSHHRLGFGKGYYDRLLEKCPRIFSIGIAYKEQYFDGDLPVEEHDQCVSEVIFV